MKSLSARIQNLRQEIESDTPSDWFAHQQASGESDARRRRESIDELTARETQILHHIVEGKSTKEIAAALGISFKTAVTHRRSIMAKLGAPNAASLVRIAITEGLV